MLQSYRIAIGEWTVCRKTNFNCPKSYFEFSKKKKEKKIVIKSCSADLQGFNVGAVVCVVYGVFLRFTLVGATVQKTRGFLIKLIKTSGELVFVKRENKMRRIWRTAD